MSIHNSYLDLIGNTPLVALKNYQKEHHVKANLLGKLESKNPAGSVKDRIAKAMIEDAEAKGLLKEGSVIIEPTSGNTGIGLAAVANAKGYRIILTMPDTMSIERRNLLKAYGAELVLTDGAKGMPGAIEKAEELARETPSSFIPSQFENFANPKVHEATTGPEIWKDTEGVVDVLVAGVGTGGTITGTGTYLKAQNPSLKIIAVEPTNSQVLAGKPAGPHGLQGIGAGFIPKVMDVDLVDEIFPVENENAYSTVHSLLKTEGLLIGISSGAALHAATEIGKREEFVGKNIVVILPDGGEKYLSTPLFEK